MARAADKYAQHVEHPRYGRGPRYTSLDPDPLDATVHLHWNATSQREIVARFQALTGKPWPYLDTVSYMSHVKRIPNTAIAADLARQTPATVPVTHYFDLERVCRDCQRHFIFFAEEQKHWYEELGFGLDSDCVRCVECRKRQQGIARKRQRYEELFHVAKRTDEENLEMAECCLSLIKASVFSHRQTQRVRMLLKRVSLEASGEIQARYEQLLECLLSLESQRGG
jgi:hypothetical protein